MQICSVRDQRGCKVDVEGGREMIERKIVSRNHHQDNSRVRSEESRATWLAPAVPQPFSSGPQ